MNLDQIPITMVKISQNKKRANLPSPTRDNSISKTDYLTCQGQVFRSYRLQTGHLPHHFSPIKSYNNDHPQN